jgi:hypothetical protein
LVYGLSVPDGTELTLPHGLITMVRMGSGSTLTLRDSQLILGAHVSADRQWKKFVIRTQNLHEWLPVTGLSQPMPTVDKKGNARHVELHWDAPKSRHAKLDDAKLSFSPRMATEHSIQPDRSIRTAIDLIVNAGKPDTLEALHQRYAVPLLGLIIFASGRADSISYEALLSAGRSYTVLRNGPDVISPQWRPDRELLFYAGQLPHFATSIARWFALHRACSPAMQVFADSVNLGASYSPARLLSVAGAIETYHRVFHDAAWKANHPKAKRGPTLRQRLEDLRVICGVPESQTGAKQANLELFVSTRNHFAHLSEPNYGYSEAQVLEATPESIQRGVALLQACLLRELGFDAVQAAERLRVHYRSWPIP